MWSNFWGETDEYGWYSKSFNYENILFQNERGCWNVPYINNIYLIKSSILKDIQGFYSLNYNENRGYDMTFCENCRYNNIFLQMFLDYLASFEEDFMTNLYNSKRYYKKCDSEDTYDQEIFKIENLQFKIDDDIELGKDSSDEYKFRYYKKYYFLLRLKILKFFYQYFLLFY